MTLTIIGIDKKKKEIGLAGTTKFISYGALAPLVDYDIGAFSTQALANPFSKRIVAKPKTQNPRKILSKLKSGDVYIQRRQYLFMNKCGECEGFTGDQAISYANHLMGNNCICGGNMLANKEVLNKMIEIFEKTKGNLAKRLMVSLGAGVKFGGDKRKGKKGSAAIVVSKKNHGFKGQGNDYINLRVDLSSDPMMDLKKLLKRREKEFEIFFTQKL